MLARPLNSSFAVIMRESRFKKFMLERGMKGYDATFVLGLIFFILVYLLSRSLVAALTFAAFFWVLSIAIFICYHFELADDYYRKVKTIAHPKGNRITNILIFVSIWVIGFAGAVAGGTLCILIFGQNGIAAGIGGGLGGALTLKSYHYLILKKLT